MATEIVFHRIEVKERRQIRNLLDREKGCLVEATARQGYGGNYVEGIRCSYEAKDSKQQLKQFTPPSAFFSIAPGSCGRATHHEIYQRGPNSTA